MYSLEQKKEVSIGLWRDIVDFYDDKNTLSWNKEHAIENMFVGDYKILHSMFMDCILCDIYDACSSCPLFYRFEVKNDPDHAVYKRCLFAKDGAGLEEAKIILKALEDLDV